MTFFFIIFLGYFFTISWVVLHGNGIKVNLKATLRLYFVLSIIGVCLLWSKYYGGMLFVLLHLVFVTPILSILAFLFFLSNSKFYLSILKGHFKRLLGVLFSRNQ